jgi:hypothetical protein
MVLLIWGCGPQTVFTGGSGGGGNSGTGGGTSSSTGGGSQASGGGSTSATQLPCDVASLLGDNCLSCHGATLTHSAPIHLVTRDDLAAPSPLDSSVTVAQRCVIRMRQTLGGMPPAPAASVPSPRIDTFDTWVQQGMPEGSGSCGGGSNGGGGSGTGGGSGATGGGTASSGGGTGTGGGVAPYDGGLAADLPCDIASMVTSKCATCHRNPPLAGATMPLLSRADFVATSTVDPTKNVAQRALLRMMDAQNPMPPVGYPAPSGTGVASFSTWVSASEPAGSCGVADAGSPPDAGPAPTTCTSGSFWTLGNTKSTNMNPGLACKACHVTNSFFNDDQFMGTVFPTLHEQDLCNAEPPADVQVEIIDKNGAVALTLTPDSPSGDFHSFFITSVQTPYTARVTNNGKTNEMTTPQTDGDCNGCHTEQGKSGAPGRIYWPQ